MSAASSAIVKPDDAEGISFVKQPGATWRDYLIMLLHIASEVEHALMVQYLYAAYSLGGKDVTPDRAEQVADWQRGILNVAREEMGHLLTVQNILALLGAPPNFNRGETPFEAALSPIPFVLAPLTKGVAASFTYAEMSPETHHDEYKHDIGHIKAETLEWAKKLGQNRIMLQPVAKLYEEIIKVLENEEKIPDAELDETSYESQASWDDWGRGYAPDPKRLTPTGDVVEGQALHHRASVIVMRAATRTDALAALHAISSQGEAEHLKHPHRIRINARHADAEEEDLGDEEEPSHFERFFDIWKNYPDGWSPVINLALNPATRASTASHRHYIEDKTIREWGLLFNARYRMLLTFLSHSYRLSRVVRAGEPNLRGAIMHRAFGEMYHIKTISGLMVQMKISKEGDEDLFAGPPFETPYSLNMPAGEADCWRLHRDLIVGSMELTRELISAGGTIGRGYLKTLYELDRQALAWVEGILRASDKRGRA